MPATSSKLKIAGHRLYARSASNSPRQTMLTAAQMIPSR